MNPDQPQRDEVLDVLALGAAGALSDDEYRALDALLATDPDLAHEYAELQMTAATLAEVSTIAPPPHLRASVLSAISDVDQLRRHDTTTPTEMHGQHRVAPSRATPEATHGTPMNVVSIHRRRWMATATIAAAVVALLVTGLVVRNVADAPSDRIAEVINDDDATTIELTGSMGDLRLVASDRQDAAVLIGSGVRPPDPGLVFQLWAIHDDQKVGMATFTPAATGELAVVVEGVGDDAEWAVTVEPEGGSEQPTSDPVAVSPGLA